MLCEDHFQCFTWRPFWNIFQLGSHPRKDSAHFFHSVCLMSCFVPKCLIVSPIWLTTKAVNGKSGSRTSYRGGKYETINIDLKDLVWSILNTHICSSPWDIQAVFHSLSYVLFPESYYMIDKNIWDSTWSAFIYKWQDFNSMHIINFQNGEVIMHKLIGWTSIPFKHHF